MALTRTRAAFLSCALFFALACACGRITGIDDYELVDCPTGTCGDGAVDGARGDGASSGDADNVGRDAPSTESAPPACGVGTARVTVQNNSNTTVSIENSGFVVAPGQTSSDCITIGSHRLRTADGEVSWIGTSCSRNNQCDFNVPPGGISITVMP